MSVLLTLAVHSLDSLLGGKSAIDMLDVPNLAMERLQLRGLVIEAGHLRGWEVDRYDAFRDRADKSGCPCLLLRDRTTINLLDGDGASSERIERLAMAANRLGCSSVSITPRVQDDEAAIQMIVTRLRTALQSVERLQLNLLVEPAEGLTSDPDRHIDLIKRIGGFRIGALPVFSAAGATGEGLEALRKTAPYAAGIIADFPNGRGKKAVKPDEALRAIREVGYSNIVALEYTGKSDPIRELSKTREAMQAVLEEE